MLKHSNEKAVKQTAFNLLSVESILILMEIQHGTLIELLSRTQEHKAERKNNSWAQTHIWDRGAIKVIKT